MACSWITHPCNPPPCHKKTQAKWRVPDGNKPTLSPNGAPSQASQFGNECSRSLSS